ncbi:hypothetical protein GGR22_002910 [Flavobacterium gossypii]|uniref:DUF4365 domain-containing protein n=1 Tax=Flavobacterium gossypii TaxID=1646119 RepID=A0ABR6DST0_9FLAO|nr:DUF4365 domain-containing protein [Flavobacterium gossypii]MBA9074737.1 hypothetical protein [Flavobacterium gossypii]
MDLPKYDNASKKGEDGITIVKTIVENELNWVFRKNHQETDFGIDAYIDIISEAGHVTGKSIALQIKTGESYFKEKNDLGWVYRGEMKHLNYYLNHDIPVIIILVDNVKKEVFWTACEPDKTIRAGENWKINVSSNQKLLKKSKSELEKHVSPVTDYVSQLEHFWEENKMLLKFKRLILIVDKDSVEKKNFSDIVSVFERIQTNPELIMNYKDNVEISIHGYDNDFRELYQIKEVVEWLHEIINKVEGWLYFLNMSDSGQFLKLIFISNIQYELHPEKNTTTKRYLEYDTKKAKDFVFVLFDNFNAFCEKHNISEEVNEEISVKFLEFIS